MSSGPIDSWLRRQMRRDANVCLALAPAALAGGILMSAFGYLFCLFLAWMFLVAAESVISMCGGRWKPTSAWSMALTWFLWVGLMVTGFRHSGEPADLTADEFSGDPGTWQSHIGLGIPVASPWVLLMFPHASSRVVLDLLHLGPRMLRGTLQLFRESGWLRTAETADAARLLSMLAVRAGRMDWADYTAEFGAVDQAHLWRVLRFLPGVVPLESGITLTEELRSLLRSVHHV